MNKNLTKFIVLCCMFAFGLSNNAFAQFASPCTQIATGGGPYTDFENPPCDANCGTPVAPAFQVWGNEGYIVNVTAGSEYVFQFCTGYSAATWPATITVAEWDGTAAGTVLGVVDGCSLTFAASNDGQVMIYVSVTTDCGGAYNQTDNGSPTLDCGPSGATCAPAGPCEADDWTNANPLDICEGTSETISVGATAVSDGGFELGFDDSAGGTGAIAGGFTFAPALPYDLNAGLGGVLAAQDPPLSDMGGTWLVTYYALDATGNRCDSTSVLTVNFLPQSDPNCAPIVCEADDWTNAGPLDLCAGTSTTIDVGPTAESNGGFEIGFDDSAGGTGGLAGGLTLTGITYPYDLNDGLNGVLAANNLPNLAGTWLLTGYAVDGAGNVCDSTSVLTVNFLPESDPNCGPVICEASAWVNDISINICSDDNNATLKLGNNANGEGGFELGFDDSQGGTGGLAGGFTIGAEFPYNINSSLNGVLTDNGIPNLGGTWLVTAYALNTSGERCDSTAVMTVNFLGEESPTNHSVTMTSPTTGFFDWDDMANVDFYQIFYRLKIDTDWTIVGGISNSQRSLNVFSNKRFYQYKIRAKYLDGSFSCFTDVTTWYASQCDVPTGVSVSFCDDTRMRVRWDNNPDEIKGKIRYRVAGTTNWITQNSQDGQNFLWVNGLPSGATIQYKVRSNCDGNDWSSYSWPLQSVTLGTCSSARESQVVADGTTKLYPNPANEALNLEFNTADASEINIVVSDNLGKQVLSLNNTYQEGTQRETLDISRLANGYYFVTIYSNDNVETLKFIKSK